MKMKMKNCLLAVVLALAMVVALLPVIPAEEVKAEQTISAQTIVNYANSVAGSYNATYAGLCLRYCFAGIYSPAGATEAGVGSGGACCAYTAGDKLIQSSSRDNIPEGCLVFFGGPSSDGKCSGCGRVPGHVGVYVGDGYVVSIHGKRSGGAVKREKIAAWESWGYPYRGWGWPKGVVITNGSAGNNPEGNVELVEGRTQSIGITGWAFDRDDASKSIEVHVYVGGEGHGVVADKYRPDVNSAFGVGDNHGFDYTINTEKTGEQHVQIYAMNVGEGSNVLLWEGNISIEQGESPTGDIDSITAGTQSINSLSELKCI